MSHPKITTDHSYRPRTSAPLVTNETRLEYFERMLREHQDTDECLLWPVVTTSNRYGKIWVAELKRCVWVHRLSFFYKHDRWPNPEALHSCDVPNCYAWAHLSEGTHQQNVQDTINRGNRFQPNVCGIENGRAKLTHEIVRAIRAEYIPGRGKTNPGTAKALARKYGVDHSVIRDIACGRTWKHVL